ncbi:hypothetical protein GWI33_014636 [Rhynchophorus ferrugineus]|uniref:K Homology domain-containing protein n=2 Tax=Rhynchophorus ferrugineus TaxID=354439 RepID=A0A834I168_RHYFE|nr:hypothetical protein GWI33_014636 [Rhynchophorus ferrugineus]
MGNRQIDVSLREIRSDDQIRMNITKICTIISIETRFVGRIIGRGGTTIREIKNHSGASVFITKETQDNKTFAQIMGPVEAIKKAYHFINKLASDPRIAKPITIISPYKAKKELQSTFRKIV